MASTTRIVWVPARKILPIHEIRRGHHFQELVARMRRHGWQGRPLAVELVGGKVKEKAVYGIGWTGVHRLAAARALHMKVPVIFINGGRVTRGRPMAMGPRMDLERYRFLKRRRDPASLLLAAEVKINAVCDEAGVL